MSCRVFGKGQGRLASMAHPDTYPIRFEVLPGGTYLRTIAGGTNGYDVEGRLRFEDGDTRFQDRTATGTLTVISLENGSYLRWHGEMRDGEGALDVRAWRWGPGFAYPYKPAVPVSAYDERVCALKADAAAKHEWALDEDERSAVIFGSAMATAFVGWFGPQPATWVGNKMWEGIAFDTYETEVDACLRAQGYAIPGES